jgi:hypothetical protein
MCLFFPALAYALYQIDNPGLPSSKYQINIRLRDSGRPLINETVWFTSSPTNVDYIVNARRLDQNSTSQSVIYYIQANNKLTAAAQTMITTKEGQTSQCSQISFDWSKMKAYYSSQDFTNNKTTSKTINLNNKTMLARSTSIYFQNLIADKITDNDFTLITPVGNSYSMHAKVSLTPENITIQGKNLSCFRVDMKPNLGFLAAILPNMAFYFMTTPPYDFVRYQGPQESPTSPNIIQEVIL